MVQFKKRFVNLYLDIISSPGFLMRKKSNALWHLKYVCPKCPLWRRKLRFVNKKKCFWFDNWSKKNYSIPRHFGVKNYLMQYTHLDTDLSKFKEKHNI